MNEDGVRPARFLASGDRSLPIPAGAAVAELAFCLPDLPDVRDFAAVWAVRGGMAPESLTDFLVAVNEVATNAVTHGHTSAKAVLRIWAVGRNLVVEIHDQGRWTPAEIPGQTPPAPYATSGMGLWVARMISSDITVETGAAGTFITMFFKV
ncbi:anti-sigma regulatory factor (Ser/Thr protein kinase) [Streptosporangium album]|uniref:Anti-sigma regulatory factor (Ser/Thr protein kinase) n=1 Tax=Streptosporangium album TaxID=47479 RepID=A0A7W7WCY2_9ACTN|nr:ATP-binding protein [Streptosporangium album]MBB4941759.1 anti-sigma regulatory factor (Ser/Thr protein kinase) [Streptosporangium album]